VGGEDFLLPHDLGGEDYLLPHDLGTRLMLVQLFGATCNSIPCTNPGLSMHKPAFGATPHKKHTRYVCKIFPLGSREEGTETRTTTHLSCRKGEGGATGTLPHTAQGLPRQVHLGDVVEVLFEACIRVRGQSGGKRR